MLSNLQNLFGKKSQGVGIEITPERVNLAQITRQGQGFKLNKYCTVDIPEGIFEEGKIVDAPSLAELIQEMLNDNKIKTRRVATGVPMREAIIRLIPIPAELDDQELRDMVLNHEAINYLPYPREEVDLDYQKLGYFQDEDGIEKVQVLLVATRREVTDTYRETFQQAGLQIDVLEINSFALIRTIREQLRQFSSNEAAVLIDIEFDNTEIAIIVNGVPQFSRTVPIGTYQLQNSLSRAMNLPTSRSPEILQGMTIPVTAFDSLSTAGAAVNPGMTALMRVMGELTDELRRSINFYLNQSEELEVVQLLLAGPGGGLAQLDEFFTQGLSVATMQIDPISALNIELHQEILPVQRPGLATVLGLGLREVQSVMYGLDVNFLKDRQLQTAAKTGAASKRGIPISWRKQLPILLGAGSALTLAGLTALLGLLLNLQINKTRTSIAALEAEINQLNAKMKQVQDIEAQVNALEGESQALVTVFNNIKPWSALLQELRRQVPTGVGIDTIEEVALPADPTTQEPARIGIRIQGFAPKYEDVNNFLLTLQSSEFIQAQKAKIEAVEKKEFPAKLKKEIPNVEVQFPQAIAYTISFELSQTPASRLLIPLSRNGAVGLVTRIKTLEQKGVLKP